MSNFEEDLNLIRQYFINPDSIDINNPIINIVINALSIYELKELFNNEIEFESHKDKLKKKLKKKMDEELLGKQTQDLILSFVDIDIANNLYEKYEIRTKKEI